MATNPQSIKPLGCVSFFVIGFIILGIIKLASCGSDNVTDKTPPTYEAPSTEMAYVQSIDFVKQYLKSPSTADFDTFSAAPSILTPTSNKYIISYHFDAENSFGAKLRSTYTCSLKYLSGNPADINSWELEQLIIDGQVVKRAPKTAESDALPNEELTKKFNIKYEIIHERQDVTGATSIVYVYVRSKKSIDKLNSNLINQYTNRSTAGFQIYYFNSKTIAKEYEDEVFNGDNSDEKIERLSTHIVARYEYNSTDGGKLIAGKEAQK